MKRLSIAMAGLVWGLLFTTDLLAQPILNRVEQIIRDQIGAARGVAQPQAEQGYLGLVADDTGENGRGVRVVDLAAGGPAASAGIERGDLITAIDNQRVTVMDDLARVVQGKPPGAKLSITFTRDGAGKTQEVTLGRRTTTRPLASPAAENVPTPAALQPATPTPGPDNSAPAGPRLGVRTMPVSEESQRQNNLPDLKGAQVVFVSPGSPAQQAGVPNGAVIVAVDGKPIEGPPDLVSAIRASTKPEVELTYIHGGEATRKSVALVAAPPRSEPPKLELRGRPITRPVPSTDGTPTASRVVPAPAPSPTSEAASDARTAALEAKIRELEARLKKLEAAQANEGK